MDEITDTDLDRRLALQRERSKLRYVETMEYFDQWHQQEKRRREQDELRRLRYERFKWLYWGAGAIAFLVITAGWGLLIGDFLRSLSQPKTVIIQMQPSPTQGPAGTRP